MLIITSPTLMVKHAELFLVRLHPAQFAPFVTNMFRFDGRRISEAKSVVPTKWRAKRVIACIYALLPPPQILDNVLVFRADHRNVHRDAGRLLVRRDLQRLQRTDILERPRTTA